MRLIPRTLMLLVALVAGSWPIGGCAATVERTAHTPVFRDLPTQNSVNRTRQTWLRLLTERDSPFAQNSTGYYPLRIVCEEIALGNILHGFAMETDFDVRTAPTIHLDQPVSLEQPVSGKVYLTADALDFVTSELGLNWHPGPGCIYIDDADFNSADTPVLVVYAIPCVYEGDDNEAKNASADVFLLRLKRMLPAKLAAQCSWITSTPGSLGVRAWPYVHSLVQDLLLAFEQIPKLSRAPR